MQKKYKKLVLIDLDGVLNQYNGKFNSDFIPPIKNGAREFLQILAENYELKLFTTRDKDNAIKWIKENDLNEYFSDVTNRKEPCIFFIDDRCIQFKGSFETLLRDIKHFCVYWKNNDTKLQ